MKEFIARSPDELEEAAQSLAEMLNQMPVAIFYGDMGVGKTTFIKVLCRKLGITETVSSPSFAIINEYSRADGEPVYHFDLYRLKQPEELLEIGGDDYFYSGDICLIEWPDKAGEYLPLEAVKIVMNELPDGSRQIRMAPFSRNLN
ncbi:tRNA (adenosine(37)-N6)-threonylcarbamoyltransferase complex ATPase subunit type 1 TsaE [Geofilum sp. OHC36d9]|uniref:tRNA (adenosine(37)-N6)-threonylcarbamoyltransferase complex ATPase subunit type 1 TsaE n=1 Tax=Geofilum sp. OHC36d9 TaxID=3458413 RepID=UPI0040342592